MNNMKRYFYGHYFKLQSISSTIAIIPSYSINNKEFKASLQIITNKESFLLDYPYSEYLKLGGYQVRIDKNIFNDDGIILDINKDGIVIKGKIIFNKFNKLKRNIMGPFKYIPFLECVHNVVSIKHSISGYININGCEYTFNDIDSYGYIEGDKGRSFPSKYIWTHSFIDNGSIMLSVGSVPFGLFKFRGIIGFINYNNKTIKIGTYKFAKVVKIENNSVIIKQGKYKLYISLIKKNELPLKAPISGKMDRIIKESAECTVNYKLTYSNDVIFDETVNNASFEYEY